MLATGRLGLAAARLGLLKLGARDRAQLVVIADESGLVRPGWHGGASPRQA
jgi:hypothetical protein